MAVLPFAPDNPVVLPLHPATHDQQSAHPRIPALPENGGPTTLHYDHGQRHISYWHVLVQNTLGNHKAAYQLSVLWMRLFQPAVRSKVLNNLGIGG